MINIQQLNKSFGSKQILNEISVSFEKGKVYGIVGQNGAGKTTLFRCIAGLEAFDGTISSEVQPLKNQLGLLLTEPFFFSKITGKEYIELLLHARKQEVGDVSVNNIFNLPLHKYASTYSTGMKKKLALTAILLQQNEVFILDEPFNGVDVEGNFLITEIIHRLKEAGKTILISSHIFNTLKDTCDEIHLLQEGNFTKSVMKSEFDQLEKEMTDIVVGDKISDLFKS
jgi:ABC-2 type transport system ATP-binding protein